MFKLGLRDLYSNKLGEIEVFSYWLSITKTVKDDNSYFFIVHIEAEKMNNLLIEGEVIVAIPVVELRAESVDTGIDIGLLGERSAMRLVSNIIRDDSNKIYLPYIPSITWKVEKEKLVNDYIGEYNEFKSKNVRV